MQVLLFGKDLVKFMFIFGAIVDGVIAVSWALIAYGFNIPNILNGYQGDGVDYRLAMYIGAMFMSGWSILLIWGAFKPYERIGLLLITAAMLFLSVIIEFVFYFDMLMSEGFILGVIKRTLIATMAFSLYLIAQSNKNLIEKGINGISH